MQVPPGGRREITEPLEPDEGRAGDLPIVAEDTYRDREELARGGLGRIIRARHQTMQRVVALKELLPETRGAEARFIREALVTGRLEHPSVVPVYEAGRWPSGEPFYAMKLVSGRPLGELVRDTPTLAGRMAFLANVIAVADAMAYAHSRRIIHRDIKPGNVIVGQFGETVVIDWGLAKDLDAAEPAGGDGGSVGYAGDEQTMIGEVLGTPAYMAPEQAMAAGVDERTDVWALGALLYFALTGMAPHATDGDPARPRETATRAVRAEAETRAEAVVPGDSAVVGPSGLTIEPPVPLSRRQPDVPRELAAIVEKAMATLPDDRYPSAREFADDLRKFQNGQLVSAHQYTVWKLLVRWLARHKGLVAAVAVATVVSLVAVAWSFVRIVAARRVAEARADELVLLQGRSALADDPTAAIAWLKAYPDRAPRQDEARRILAEARARGVAHDVWRDHAEAVGTLVLSAGGRELASADGEGGIRVRPFSGGPVRVLQGADSVLALTPDGKRVAVATEANEIVLLEPRQRLGAHDDGVNALAFSPDGQLVASASRDRTVRVWPVAGGEARVFRGHELETTGVAFSPDGARLASTSEDRTVRVWTLASGEARVFHAESPTLAVAFSADGQTIAVAARGGVHLWDLRRADDRPSATRDQPGHEVYAVSFTPAGLVALGGVDGLELATPALAPVLRLAGHAGPVNAIAVAPDGRMLYSGGADSTVRAWPLPAEVGQTLRDGNQPDGTGARPRISADGRRVAAPGRDGTILVVTGDARQELRGHDGPVKEIAFLPDGNALLSLGQDQTIRLWDLATGNGRVLHTTRSQAFRLRVAADGRHAAFTEGFEDLSLLGLPEGRVVCVFPSRSNTGSELAPDGAHVAFAQGGEVRWGDIASCSARTLYRHEGSLFTIAFTRDSAWIATASGDTSVGLASTTGGEARFLRSHRRGVYAVAFSPDGESLASGDFVGEGRIWRRRDGAVVAELHGHAKALLFLGWTPDGARVVSSGGDDTVRLWDAVGGEIVSREVGTGGGGFAIHPDGRRIVSAGSAGIRVWPVDTRPPPPVDHAARRAWMDEQTTAVIDGDRVASPD